MEINDTNSHSPAHLPLDPLPQMENALALHQTYSLISQIYLNGLTAESLAWIQEISELSEALDADSVKIAEAPAIHQELLGLNIFPYESIFLDTSGMFGGHFTDHVSEDYRGLGYRPNPASTSPDHLGEELNLLAFLCGAEADAWEDNLPATAQRLHHVQLEFMQTHLLRWLFPSLQAVCTEGYPFYTALAELTIELIHTHYIALVDPSTSSPVTWQLPTSPSLLEDDKTGLKEIADYLMTPAYSGIFLSRNGLGRIGRSQRLPRGFGNRTQLLVNMMRSAIQYEGLPQLTAELSQLYRHQIRTYQENIDTMPEFAAFIRPWKERAELTCQMLEQIQLLSLEHEN